jgi:hypothetical protein
MVLFQLRELIMNKDSENTPKCVSGSRSRIYGVAALCIIVLFVLYFILIDPLSSSKPKAPDLSRCTRLEVHFSQPIMEYLSLKGRLDPNFLDASEYEYIQSMKEFVVDDGESINHISHVVSSGRYNKAGKREINVAMYRFNVSITGYSDDERIEVIKMYKHRFVLDGELHALRWK